MTGISAVQDALQRRPVAGTPRGELVIDRRFARDFLTSYTDTDDPDTLPDSQLLLRFCQVAQLDLVCIQSEQTEADNPMLSVRPEELHLFQESGLFIFWIVNGPFQTLMATLGMMKVLRDIAAAPAGVGEELHRQAAAVTALIKQGVASGAHGILLADDIAYSRSTLMSPVFVEKYLLPEWRIQVDAARELGVPIFFHSDGNLSKVLPHIAAAGFAGLQCIEPASGMDIRQIKQQYGKELCLMGNIDPALLVEHDSALPDQGTSLDRLRKAVSELLTTMEKGGFIFGTCSGLHAGMSPQLVNAMYQMLPCR